MQFIINPVNVIISYNSMSTFNYICVLLITYNPDKTARNSAGSVCIICISQQLFCDSLHMYTWLEVVAFVDSELVVDIF